MSRVELMYQTRYRDQ